MTSVVPSLDLLELEDEVAEVEGFLLDLQGKFGLRDGQKNIVQQVLI